MLFRFLSLGFILALTCYTPASAQVIKYPNGKKIKILSTSAGAHQLSGNQQRYIASSEGLFYNDPEKDELEERQARARLRNLEESEYEEPAPSNESTE